MWATSHGWFPLKSGRRSPSSKAFYAPPQEETDRGRPAVGQDQRGRRPRETGRVQDAETITVTKNEILYSLNKPDDFILAMVEFLPDDSYHVHYLRQLFQREPDFGVTSVNYTFADLLARADAPR